MHGASAEQIRTCLTGIRMFRPVCTTSWDVTHISSEEETDTIRRNVDQGCLKGAVVKDLRKAFDTVDHTIQYNTIVY